MNEVTALNLKVIEEFRANGGKVGPPFEGSPLLLLGTIGAKTGAERTNPLVYVEDEGRIIIVASFAGADASPPWFHNLKANPEVTVEIGTEKYQARASIVDEPDRTRLYQKMEAAMPIFTEYQSKTTRVIPVVALERI